MSPSQDDPLPVAKRRRSVSRRDVLTTSEIARRCQVAPRTVQKWFDAGKLKGYRVPGCQHRRVLVADLDAFMVAHGMVGLAPPAGGSIVTVGLSARLSAAIAGNLRIADGYVIHPVRNPYEVGAMASSCRADALIVDLGIGDLDARSIADGAISSAVGEPPILVAVLGTRSADDAFGLGYRETFRGDSDAAILAERVGRLVLLRRRVS